MSFCRDCLADLADNAARCPACGSPRLAHHRELDSLTIAHVDCDAFYATIEKRDDPSLADKPVVVGGGKRGVVAAACYIARTYGIRSAMPMFEAKRRCPEAIVVKPNMAKYVAVGREVRRRMFDLTPLVEPLSIDEAFLDLTGTERLHGMSAAKALARFATAVERDLGITVSIGLSANKFLAKIASDMDKPRGFAVLGQDEAAAFLAPKPVGFIYGVGAVSAAKLASDGYRLIADLQHAEERELMRALWRGRRAAVAAGPRHRLPQCQRRARDQKHFRRNHLQRGHRRLPPAGAISLGIDRARVVASESQRAGRLDGDAQAQERRFQDPHAGAFVGRADAIGGADLFRRARFARA